MTTTELNQLFEMWPSLSILTSLQTTL